MSPTQRTLKELRSQGFTCAITEHWNQWAKIRVDLWGWCDILAMKVGFGILAVQCTSRSNHNARKAKILASPLSKIWLACGGKIEVRSHGKLKAGWTTKIEEITLKHFE